MLDPYDQCITFLRIDELGSIRHRRSFLWPGQAKSISELTNPKKEVAPDNAVENLALGNSKEG